MRLTIKLVSFVLAAVMAIVAIDALLTIRQETKLAAKETERYLRLLARSLHAVLLDSIGTVGREDALDILMSAQAAEDLRVRPDGVTIRWIRLDVPVGDTCAPLIPTERLQPLRHTQETFGTFLDKQGREVAYVCRLLPPSEEGREALEITEPSSAAGKYAQRTAMRTLLLSSVMVIVLTVLTAILGVWLVGRPLRTLVEKARRVGRGDLSGPVRLRGKDELSRLGESMNTMCANLEGALRRIREETEARISALEQLRHADRLKTAGRLASGIAHEVGTPLNIISGRAGLIVQGQIGNEEIVKSARVIRAQSDRITRLIRKLLDFARRPPCERRPVDLRTMIRETTELLKPQMRQAKVTLRLALGDDPLTVCVDSSQLQQVFINLIVNAVEAMPGGGQLELKGDRVRTVPPDKDERGEEDYVRVRVTDDGIGISEEDQRLVFEPFFTTKDVGQGTGLGLSVAYGIMLEHSGWISVESEVGAGSRFSVYLPLGT